MTWFGTDNCCLKYSLFELVIVTLLSGHQLKLSKPFAGPLFNLDKFRDDQNLVFTHKVINPSMKPTLAYSWY